MNDRSGEPAEREYQRQLRDMNEALLVSSVRQHELIEQAEKAKEALRESEQRYRSLFNSMDEGYCIIEMIFDKHEKPVDYRFLEVNPAFDEQSGMHDVTGRRMLEFVSDIQGPWLANYGKVAVTGEPMRFAGEYKALNRSFDVYAFRVGAPDSRRVAVLFTDITQLKRFEREREAMLINEQASRMEAQAANRAKDVFLATLSHEMRTPLNAIVGWISILRSDGCNEEDLREGLDVIDRNTKAQVQLIEDVLDVSRIVSGKLRLEVKPCELIEAIKAGIDVVRPAAEARDITLDVQLDPAASRATCDSTRIQQVVWNLVSNAVKFTPKGGTVRVALSRDQSTTRIQVSDSGQGISPELLPYVFDRFRQADSSTRRRFGGLGLGLSIVKHLIELHGGTVEAHSAGEGKGATFAVLLPIKAVRIDEDPEEKADRRGQAGELHDPEDGAGGAYLPLVRLDGLRVLVVDDEPDARRLLIKVLEAAGATVTAAGSAADALDLLPTVKPEVLVSDLGMPAQDGYDLIRQVRAGGRNVKELPAVALTAFIHKDDTRQALLAGFQVHVPKPVDPHDLTAVIASLTGRTGGTEHASNV